MSELTDNLRSLAAQEYAEDFDEAFYHLYRAASTGERERLRSFVAGKPSPRPRKFRNTDFPCRVDIRTPEQLRVRTLFALLRETSPDFRDDLCSIAWHYHTAGLFGLDPDAYLQEFEPLASPHMRSVLNNFLSRSASDKAMDKWCHYVADSPQGKYIEFRPPTVPGGKKSPAPPRPNSRNLVAALAGLFSSCFRSRR
jgi:hypothetical protein